MDLTVYYALLSQLWMPFLLAGQFPIGGASIWKLLIVSYAYEVRLGHAYVTNEYQILDNASICAVRLEPVGVRSDYGAQILVWSGERSLYRLGHAYVTEENQIMRDADAK